MKEHLETLKDELEEGQARLVDVREQNEWDAGHVSGAVFLPLSALKEGVYPDEDDLKRDQRVYLYCRSGNRVHAAKALLEAMGYKRVTPLQEGFSELVALGFPAE